MKQDLTDILIEKFPLLYVQGKRRIYFECSEGWFEPIYNLSAKIEPLIQKYIEEAEDKEDYPRAIQVKEKFGGLRFYMSHGTPEMYKLIEEAEKICYKTCEDCGKPGELAIDGYWYRTLCEECIDKMNKGFIDHYGEFRIRNYAKCSDLKKEREKKEKNGNEEKGKEESSSKEKDASQEES